MELKFQGIEKIYEANEGSNRTFMELKYVKFP